VGREEEAVASAVGPRRGDRVQGQRERTAWRRA